MNILIDNKKIVISTKNINKTNIKFNDFSNFNNVKKLENLLYDLKSVKINENSN